MRSTLISIQNRGGQPTARVPQWGSDELKNSTVARDHEVERDNRIDAPQSLDLQRGQSGESAKPILNRWTYSRRDQDLPTVRSVRVEILFSRNLFLRSRWEFQRGIRRQGGCSVEASLANFSACSFS
ncbi:hypothetical protein TNCV_1593541 [Trichonephila clavipes]|nr:hypothetical protein TNCV_1593541 [Trichonephila clavipes]